MGYKVKIVTAPHTKTATGANGDYTYTSFEVDYNGQVSEKRIMPSVIKKYPNLKDELASIKEGMIVGIDTVKEGNYTVITKLTPEAANSTTNNTGGSKTNDDYNTGQQVGNALTNAAATLGGKATVKQLEDRAWEIILAGNRLKERLKKGDHIIAAVAAETRGFKMLDVEPPSVTDDIHAYEQGDEDIPF